MRSMVISFDSIFSILIFIGLLYYLGSTWNLLVQELEERQTDLLQLRTQQALTYIFKQVGKGHEIEQDKIEFFVDQTINNYTATKENLGLSEFELKFLVKDMNNTILYQTNTTPSGELIVTSTRYGVIDQPVRLDLWVWR